MREQAHRKMAKKHVILFLAANPCDTGRLALDEEAHWIHAELKRSNDRDRFDFVTRWAPEPLDLLRELRELKPTIVHFAGYGAPSAAAGESLPGDAAVTHAASGGVIVNDGRGRSQVVSAEAIAQTIDAVGGLIRLVVLNACYTAPLAEALLAHIDCVVGMSGAIPSNATRCFAVGFYGGLAGQESIAAAFKQGTAAISLDGLPDTERPRLVTRDAFDTNQTIEELTGWKNLPCPYPGMRPFRADEGTNFHGHTREVRELIDLLRTGEHEIYVIGPSGSGKSSLVAAGVLPLLARGVAGLGRVVVRHMRPGEQPTMRLSEILGHKPGQGLLVPDAIAAQLCDDAPDSWLLLVIDQLEELFTLAPIAERDAFLTALRALRGERQCAVIVTLRADFFGALMESPLWPERGRDQLSRIEVAPLRGEALRDAIMFPAHEVGVDVDLELVERLLADTASEPGTLPLLQETMIQLWNQRADQTLTLMDYQALGDGARSGLAVAVSRRADATLRKFNSTQVGIARRILLRLISFGEGRSDTRRQQTRAQLRAAGDAADDFDMVLQTMVGDRLLTIDEDFAGEPKVEFGDYLSVSYRQQPRTSPTLVGRPECDANAVPYAPVDIFPPKHDRRTRNDALIDLAHEALIAGWPELQRWIRERRNDEQRRRQLELRAAEWVSRSRDEVGLFDAVELAEAGNWISSEGASELGYTDDLSQFLKTSHRVIEQIKRMRQETERRRQEAERLRQEAEHQQQEVERQREIAAAAQLRERAVAQTERERLRRRLSRFVLVAISALGLLGLVALSLRSEANEQRNRADFRDVTSFSQMNSDLRDDNDTKDKTRVEVYLRALLDVFNENIGGARTRLGADAPETDILLLKTLAEFAHNELENNYVALLLLQRAHDLDTNDIDTEIRLAEVQLLTRRYGDFQHTVAELGRRDIDSHSRVIVGALQWIAARVTHQVKNGHHPLFLRTYQDLADHSRVEWSWKGTANALTTGEYPLEDVQPILVLIGLLQEPISNDTRTKMFELERERDTHAVPPTALEHPTVR